MNCANHVDVPATAYCRTCGKPLCSICKRDVRGVVYCEECVASQMSGTMPPPPTPGVAIAAPPPVVGGSSPGLAAVLGFIPGVGAMYNGEYAKAFVHVLIFATLIWMADHVNGIFGLAIAAFVLYMPFEAFQTAKAKSMGLQPPDPFGFNHMFGSGAPAASAPVAAPPPGGEPTPGVPYPQAVEAQPREAEYPETTSRIPVGAFILIGLGVLFLLDEVGWLHFDWVWRFWPVILIAIGVRILMKRRGMSW